MEIIQEKLHIQDSSFSQRQWRIKRDIGHTREKEGLQGLRKSLYWLTFGLNSSKLYQSDVGNPFTETLTDSDTQQEFKNGLYGVKSFYEGEFQFIPGEDECANLTIVGSYVGKLGKASIQIRETSKVLEIEHQWKA